MMHFNKDSLRELATNLCKIDCSDEELERLMQNLEAILEHVEELNSLNTEGVEPCTHISTAESLLLGPDEESDIISTQDYMLNVPAKGGGMVKVPTIIKSSNQ